MAHFGGLPTILVPAPQAAGVLVVAWLNAVTLGYIQPPRSVLNAARRLGCRLRFCDDPR